MLTSVLFLVAMFAAPAQADTSPVSVPLSAAETTPQTTGTGAIAEDCKIKFADPAAQTACEVVIRMDIERGTSANIELLRQMVDHLFHEIERQDEEIKNLHRQLDAANNQKKGK